MFSTIVLFWQPQRLCILGSGMCLSVLPASSYSRSCCTSVRLTSTISSTRVNCSSCSALQTWDERCFQAAVFPPIFFCFFPLFPVHFISVFNWSDCWRNFICAAIWGRLLSAIETEITGERLVLLWCISQQKKGGGQWSSGSLWGLETQAGLVRDAQAWNKTLLKPLPLSNSTKSPFKWSSCYICTQWT